MLQALNTNWEASVQTDEDGCRRVMGYCNILFLLFKLYHYYFMCFSVLSAYTSVAPAAGNVMPSVASAGKQAQTYVRSFGTFRR